MRPRAIWCCACNAFVQARLTDGREIYPRFHALADKPFWLCDDCSNYVGCHHKISGRRTQPLGVIPTPELRAARKHIHDLIDPLWKLGHLTRNDLYTFLSHALGRPYHTADLRTLEEARTIYREGLKLRRQYGLDSP